MHACVCAYTGIVHSPVESAVGCQPLSAPANQRRARERRTQYKRARPSLRHLRCSPLATGGPSEMTRWGLAGLLALTAVVVVSGYTDGDSLISVLADSNDLRMAKIQKRLDAISKRLDKASGRIIDQTGQLHRIRALTGESLVETHA